MWMTSLIVAGTVLFLFPFVIYPAILMAAKTRPRRIVGGKPDDVPTVALVICALNEENVIRSKVENSLNLDYPRDRLRIVVISDGSTDRTAEIVKEYVPAGIEFIDRPARRGKIANLNDVLPTCTEEILVLSDANVLYRADALKKLIARFDDPSVGCVSGKVILTDTTDILDGPTTQYYSLEWTLQEKSSELYSMVGADGAMYAFRRELFRPCPPDTLIEDFVIAIEIVRQGKRVVFEPEAIGWEPGVRSVSEEFRRKVRIAAGSAQALIRGSAWPKNAPLRFWFIFLSHKLLRWLSPLTGTAILLLCMLSLGQTLSALLTAGFVLLAVLAAFRMIAGWNHPVFSAPFYFLFSQVAMAIGLWKGCLGQQTVLWAKANR